MFDQNIFTLVNNGIYESLFLSSLKINKMKTKLFLFLAITIFVTVPSQTKAQKNGEPAFKKGSKILGFAAGLGGSYNYYNDYNAIPVLALIYDQGFFDEIGPGNIGIGGIVAFKSATYKYSSDNYKATWTSVIIGVRGTYHLTLLKDKNNKFDPYAGIMIGVKINHHKDTHFNSQANNPYNYGNAVVSGAFIGAKYNFAKVLGVFAEVGYDISFARVGLCLNF